MKPKVKRARRMNFNSRYWRFIERASRWARRHYPEQGHRGVCAAHGFKAGYAAALRDVRAGKVR